MMLFKAMMKFHDADNDGGKLLPSDIPLTLCQQWEHHLQQFLLPLFKPWAVILLLGGKSLLDEEPILGGESLLGWTISFWWRIWTKSKEGFRVIIFLGFNNWGKNL